jgi:hypothetical protein
VSTTPLRLLPRVAAQATERCARLDISFSSYVAILLWNQEQAPARLAAEPHARDLVRTHVPCSWRAGVRARAKRLATDTDLNVNALVEALIARDVRHGGGPLVILPRGG